MAWVFGGAIGIVLPLNGALGLSVAAALVAAGGVLTVRGLLGAARRRRDPARRNARPDHARRRVAGRRSRAR